MHSLCFYFLNYIYLNPWVFSLIFLTCPPQEEEWEWLGGFLVSSQGQPTIVWRDGQRPYNESWDLFAASKWCWISHYLLWFCFILTFYLFVYLLLKNCYLPFEQRTIIIYLWSTYSHSVGSTNRRSLHNNKRNLWLNCCCCSSGTSLTHAENKLQDWRTVLVPHFLQPFFLKGSTAVQDKT